jgi:hypothetical protein
MNMAPEDQKWRQHSTNKIPYSQGFRRSWVHLCHNPMCPRKHNTTSMLTDLQASLSVVLTQPSANTRRHSLHYMDGHRPPGFSFRGINTAITIHEVMLMAPRLGAVITTICLADSERDHLDIKVSRASCGTPMKTRRVYY